MKGEILGQGDLHTLMISKGFHLKNLVTKIESVSVMFIIEIVLEVPCREGPIIGHVKERSRGLFIIIAIIARLTVTFINVQSHSMKVWCC